MKKDLLDPKSLSSAKALTALVLNEADHVRPGCRMEMQAEFHLRNGIFSRS